MTKLIIAACDTTDHPICYDWMAEEWRDAANPNFRVSMTPDGELPDGFASQEEFWRWYRGAHA